MAEHNSVCLFIPQSHKFRLILATSKNDFLPWLTLTCDSIKLQMFVRAAVGIVCIFLTPLHSGSIFPCLWRSVMQVVTGNAPSFCYEGERRVHNSFVLFVTWVTSPSIIRIHFFSGLLPPLDPAEDSVSALHQESAVRHIAHQPEPLPVLPPQEVHLGRNEQRR